MPEVILAQRTPFKQVETTPTLYKGHPSYKVKAVGEDGGRVEGRSYYVTVSSSGLPSLVPQMWRFFENLYS